MLTKVIPLRTVPFYIVEGYGAVWRPAGHACRQAEKPLSDTAKHCVNVHVDCIIDVSNSIIQWDAMLEKCRVASTSIPSCTRALLWACSLHADGAAGRWHLFILAMTLLHDACRDIDKKDVPAQAVIVHWGCEAKQKVLLRKSDMRNSRSDSDRHVPEDQQPLRDISSFFFYPYCYYNYC